MSQVVTISGRSVGSRRPLFADWSIPLPPDDFGDEGLTLRGLIERIVRGEVEAYAARRERRHLDRVFSKGQIDAGVLKGRVSPEGKELPPPPPAEAAVGTALQAFEDGVYLVFVDDQEQRALDGRVYLKPSSRVMFVRLVFLAGG